MAFPVWPRGCGWGKGWEYATTEELQELGERILVMERWSIRLEETSDEEEYVEEAEPQGEIDTI